MPGSAIHICIGLTTMTPAWELLLGQIGIRYDTVDFRSDLLSEYSVIIVNSPLTSPELDTVKKYSSEGGSILFTDPHYFSTCKKRLINFILPGLTESFSLNTILDLRHRCTVFDNNSIVLTRHNGSGTEGFLGLDIDTLYSSNDSRRKSFPSPVRPYPNEVVSSVSKNGLRQLLTSLLEHLHHVRSIPFVHKWYYPENHRTIFTFRVDSDKGKKEQIQNLYEVSAYNAIPTTWFLDVKSHEDWLNYFTSFQDQEIGVHCYEHVLHRSVLLNKENFGKARMLLKKNGIDTAGITSPTGAWNLFYANAIQELGFTYSSEFSYDYDNLPSFPYYKDIRFDSVQLPIHPICVGSMIRSHFSDEQMAAYFKEIIDSKVELKEPICLYHHPTHGHTEVFREVFQYINSLQILKLSYSHYASWWIERRKCVVDCTFKDNTLYLNPADNPDRQWVRISVPGMKETIAPIKERIDLSQLLFSPQNHIIPDNDGADRLRAFYLRQYIQNILDWWIKVTE